MSNSLLYRRMGTVLTYSIECEIRYWIITTSCVWPIQCTLSMACSSAIGFHCGSIRYTRQAAVRSSLNLLSVPSYSQSENRSRTIVSYTLLLHSRWKLSEQCNMDLCGMMPQLFSFQHRFFYHLDTRTDILWTEVPVRLSPAF